MTRHWRAPIATLAGLTLLLAACGGDDGGPAEAATIFYGVTSANQLVSFHLESPGQVTTTAITGLGTGKAIRAIDYRVPDVILFGLGSDGQVYLMNRSSGEATEFTDTLSAVQAGSTFGFDLNPVANRLRVITDQDSSLRINAETGLLAATDTPVAYAAGDVNVGANPAIVGAAYSNNVAGAATTVLYAIDQDTDALVIVDPPNNGELHTVGALGVNVAGDIGFDIASDGTAYAALVLQGSTEPSLYTINLTTGAATLVGAINAARLTGLTVRP